MCLGEVSIAELFSHQGQIRPRQSMAQALGGVRAGIALHRICRQTVPFRIEITEIELGVCAAIAGREAIPGGGQRTSSIQVAANAPVM